ncbi:cell cycle control protein 50A isoform X1 [Hyalella azteca]|uniref:Cell cycle control protein 50A isoform X1 n=2 Tax=Hyalella azteca TaxID=294128 RepID=A0A8B7P6R0_HYAAZ|nr:cell cycle control protein 50A isoform X1 [Hyalella azteca]
MSVNNGMSDHTAKSRNSKFKQKFKQQRLPAWQPILTADTVLPAFFLIGLLFVPLGVALLLFSDGVVEVQVDYTECPSVDPRHRDPLGGHFLCKDLILRPEFVPGENFCYCDIEFNVTTAMENEVFMYYGLDNYYQNHRRYVKSRDDKQLAGKQVTDVSDCSPFDRDNRSRIYAPCGAIANSFFNDSLKLYFTDSQKGKQEVPLRGDNIAWDSDKNIKFKNPPGKTLDDKEGGAFENTVKPLYWTKPVFKLGSPPNNTGYENEDLIVWMRTAAFPSFRKLYRRVDNSNLEFKKGLAAGLYTLHVDYNYPVHTFGGRKRMILSTTSFLGGKNNFLGIAYITAGCVCFLLGVVFLVIHVKFGERTTNHLNINQNTPYTK